MCCFGNPSSNLPEREKILCIIKYFAFLCFLVFVDRIKYYVIKITKIVYSNTIICNEKPLGVFF